MAPSRDDCESRFEATCKQEFAEVKHLLNNLDLAIRGDGDQKPGLAGRLARVERTVRSANKVFWIAIGAAITSVIGLAVTAVWAACM